MPSKVTPAQVNTFVGSSPGPDERIQATIDVVEVMVRTYVRGNGFDADGDPNDALTAVIVSASARLAGNPSHQQLIVTGPFQHRPGTFDGWTLPELAILNQYRRRTA